MNGKALCAACSQSSTRKTWENKPLPAKEMQYVLFLTCLIFLGDFPSKTFPVDCSCWSGTWQLPSQETNLDKSNQSGFRKDSQLKIDHNTENTFFLSFLLYFSHFFSPLFPSLVPRFPREVVEPPSLELFMMCFSGDGGVWSKVGLDLGGPF